MSLPIVPAFMPEFVAIDFESDPIFESKAKILKDLESSPLLISLDCLLEGAPAHALAAAAASNLGLQFEMVYALRDDPPKMLALFFERLRLFLDSLPAEKFFLIPFKDGAKFTSVFGLPAVLDQFVHVRSQLKTSAEASASERIDDLLKNASPSDRAALKGKGKKLPAKKAGRLGKLPKPPSALLPRKMTVQTILASPLAFSVPKKPSEPEGCSKRGEDDGCDQEVLADTARLEVLLCVVLACKLVCHISAFIYFPLAFHYYLFICYYT